MQVRSLLVAAVALSATLAACSSSDGDGDGPDDAGRDAAATSAEDFGGLDGLVTAAEKEGTLNVVGLLPERAGYAAVVAAFEAKYDVDVRSEDPEAGGADQVAAAIELEGTDDAPDVFDLGQSVALANADLFAPYRVATFDDIPQVFKDPEGAWVNDYGGFMSIGYDSEKVPDITGVDDLLDPALQGKVALNGDPRQVGAAFIGVLMASLAHGGSADDLAPGVDFFEQLEAAGNFLQVDTTAGTIESGETPVVIDWDYVNAAATATVDTWEVVVPEGVAIAGYYFQAINKGAPHPAAARLWQEFLYSDEGQNLWLAGGVRPVRADAMLAAGTIDRERYDALPEVSGDPVIPTNEQTEAMAAYLADAWTDVVGG